MPINSTHPEYDENVRDWSKCRIAVEGEDSVKAAGEMFLPRLSGQDNKEYASYKERGVFFNASSRTVDGVTGMVFRKEPTTQWPESQRSFLENVGNHTDFATFAQKVVRRVLCAGRYGVLIDLPEITSTPRPFWVGYSAENITNWNTRRDPETGEEELTLVVLREDGFEPSEKDPYKWEEVRRFRELRLDDEKVYRQQLWKSEKRDGREVFVRDGEEITPQIRGNALNYIPFVIFGPTDLSASVEKPPILDIVNVNMSHWRNSCDLEHGLHFTALPTPWVAGFQTEDELTIGSSKAWVSENERASAGYLEFSGSGLSAIEARMKSKEDMMVVLGARLLEAPKRAVEAAESHRERKSGEESIVATLANVTSSGLTRLLQWSLEWLGTATGASSVELNTDFITQELPEGMLKTLITAVQSELISLDTFYYNLKRGELLPDGRTMEEELDLIAQQEPRLGTASLLTDDEEDEGEEDDEAEGEEDDV